MAAYATSTDVRLYLGISSTSDNTLITALIARAQSAIDKHTRRTFSSTANSTRYFTVGQDTSGRRLYLDADLADIGTVTTDADSTSPVTISSTEYITLPRNRAPYYALEIKSSCTKSWDYSADPESGVTITGKWAYSTSPPNDIKHACIRLSAFYYRQKDAQVFDTTAIPEAGVITVPVGLPSDVEKILRPYVRTHLVVSG